MAIALAPRAGMALELDELLRRMAATPGVHARFHEVKEIALLAAPLESDGEIFFVPPRRFARLTSAPAPTRFVIDGDRLSFRDEAGGQQIDLARSAVARAVADNFLVLWNGDAAGLAERYTAELDSSGERWRLVLRPRSDRVASVVKSVTLEGVGARLEEMQLLEPNGDVTRTRFEDVRTDAPLTPEELARAFGDGGAR